MLIRKIIGKVLDSLKYLNLIIFVCLLGFMVFWRTNFLRIFFLGSYVQNRPNKGTLKLESYLLYKIINSDSSNVAIEFKLNRLTNKDVIFNILKTLIYLFL